MEYGHYWDDLPNGYRSPSARRALQRPVEGSYKRFVYRWVLSTSKYLERLYGASMALYEDCRDYTRMTFR